MNDDDVIGANESNSVFNFCKDWMNAVRGSNFSHKRIPVRIRTVVPSKRSGRKGTRRGWKRLNPPMTIYIDPYPIDVGMLPGSIEDKTKAFTFTYAHNAKVNHHG